MKVFSIAKGFHRLNKKAPPELSQKEIERLRAIRLYKETQDIRLACKSFEKGIKLFVLPPKSPKLNGSVERANRTHTEESHKVNDFAWTVSELNKQLRQWEYI